MSLIISPYIRSIHQEKIHNILSLLIINLFLLGLYALTHYAFWRNGIPILHSY